MTGAIPSFTPVLGLPIGTPPLNAPGITQGINVLSGVKTNISTGGTLSFNVGGTSSINTGGAMSIKTGGVMDFSVGGAMNLLAGAAFNATAGAAMNLSAGGITNLDGSVVNIGMGASPACPPLSFHSMCLVLVSQVYHLLMLYLLQCQNLRANLLQL